MLTKTISKDEKGSKSDLEEEAHVVNVRDEKILSYYSDDGYSNF